MRDDLEARRRDAARLCRLLLEGQARIWLHTTAHWREQCQELGIKYEDLLTRLGEEDDEDMDYYKVEQYLKRTYEGRYVPCPDPFEGPDS